MVAAGVLAGGVGHQAVEAGAAKESNRTELPRLEQVPRGYPNAYVSSAGTARDSNQAILDVAVAYGPVDASVLRGAVGKALARPRAGASTSQPAVGAAGPGAGQLADATAPPAANATQPVRGVVETAKTVVKEVPEASSTTSASRGGPEPAGLTPAGAAAPARSPAAGAAAAAPAAPASADPPGPGG